MTISKQTLEYNERLWRVITSSRRVKNQRLMLTDGTTRSIAPKSACTPETVQEAREKLTQFKQRSRPGEAGPPHQLQEQGTQVKVISLFIKKKDWKYQEFPPVECPDETKILEPGATGYGYWIQCTPETLQEAREQLTQFVIKMLNAELQRHRSRVDGFYGSELYQKAYDPKSVL